MYSHPPGRRTPLVSHAVQATQRGRSGDRPARRWVGLSRSWTSCRSRGPRAGGPSPRGSCCGQLGHLREQARELAARPMTSMRMGVFAVTVAVRGRWSSSAISPMYDPAPRVATTRSPWRTSISPSSTMMNSWPGRTLAGEDGARRLLEVRRELRDHPEVLLGEPFEQRHLGELLLDPVVTVHRFSFVPPRAPSVCPKTRVDAATPPAWRSAPWSGQGAPAPVNRWR